MNKQKLNILILENDPYDAELMVRELEKEGFEIEWKRVNTEKTFKKALTEKPDIILSDFKLHSFDGMSAIKLQQKISPDIPFILVSGTIGEELAVECMKVGAIDYVLKGKLSRLSPVVKRELKEVKYRREHKQADKRLIESEEKYRVLFETASDAMFLSDETGKFIDVNQAACESLGYTKDELLKMSNKDIDAESSGYSAFMRVRDDLAEEMTFEVNQIRKDGTILPVEITGCFFTSDNKKIALAIARDITEWKNVEKILKESEKKIRAMFHSIRDHMSMMDKELNIVWANEIAKKTFGNDIIGKKCYEVYHKSKKPCEPYPCIVLKALQDEKVHEHNTQVINKDGEIIYFHCTAYVALKDKNGKPATALEISRDVTKETHIKNALQESEERYRTMIEHANDMIWTLDTQGHFTFYNHQAEIISEHKFKEWKGKSFAPLIHPDDIEIVGEVFRKTLSGESQNYSVRINRSNGEMIILSVNTAPIYKEGKIVGTVSFGRDITEQEKAKEEVKKRLAELEVYYKVTIGREERIIELKQEINLLLERLGEKRKFGV